MHGGICTIHHNNPGIIIIISGIAIPLKNKKTIGEIPDIIAIANAIILIFFTK
ncbi:unnamed protein product [marine sediment metagenome]|uniref:Uncharacterized protein n=1 Tax=marine sediment metagenome TaxID=412755 RepID=X1HA58_9ZZZZ